MARRTWQGGVLALDLLFGNSNTSEASAALWVEGDTCVQPGLVGISSPHKLMLTLKGRHSGVSHEGDLVGGQCCLEGGILRNSELLT